MLLMLLSLRNYKGSESSGPGAGGQRPAYVFSILSQWVTLSCVTNSHSTRGTVIAVRSLVSPK